MTVERDACFTCGDVAVAAKVVRVEGADAVVSVAGAEERVAVDLVPDAETGDVLLCHAGIAIARVDDP